MIGLLTVEMLATTEEDRKSVDILRRQRSLRVGFSRGSYWYVREIERWGLGLG